LSFPRTVFLSLLLLLLGIGFGSYR
jgi:hypothetical protein